MKAVCEGSHQYERPTVFQRASLANLDSLGRNLAIRGATTITAEFREPNRSGHPGLRLLTPVVSRERRSIYRGREFPSANIDRFKFRFDNLLNSPALFAQVRQRTKMFHPRLLVPVAGRLPKFLS